jgi:H+/gluconate symporter-like permease
MQLRNTIIALIVAAAFFNFAIMFKHWIIAVGTGALLWFGFRWLIRNHLVAAFVLVSFLRGLLGSRR